MKTTLNPFENAKRTAQGTGGGVSPAVIEKMQAEISVLGSQNKTQAQDITDIKGSLNSINDKLTLKELASVNTASGKTFQNALLELKTTWDTLTIAEKVNSTLYYANNILYPNTTSGIYSRVTLSSSALVVIILNISTGQSLFYNGGTITDKSNDPLDANLSLKGF